MFVLLQWKHVLAQDKQMMFKIQGLTVMEISRTCAIVCEQVFKYFSSRKTNSKNSA